MLIDSYNHELMLFCASAQTRDIISFAWGPLRRPLPAWRRLNICSNIRGNKKIDFMAEHTQVHALSHPLIH